MKEEIYSWMKNLAVFYILLHSVVHLVPNKGYERYVRFFMGLLLILMLGTPVFSFLGKGEELLESFQMFYDQENTMRQKKELANLQEIYLKKAYEQAEKEGEENDDGIEEDGNLKLGEYEVSTAGNGKTAMDRFADFGDTVGGGGNAGVGQ